MAPWSSLQVRVKVRPGKMLANHVRHGRCLCSPFRSLGQTATKSPLWLPAITAAAAARLHAVASHTNGGAPASTDIYHGPFTVTLRRLKIFSLSSLALSTSLTPFMFIIESALPLGARVALATTAITTSGISTALVAWCGSPYVATLRRLGGDVDGLELVTFSLTLKPLVTRVYDTTFLVETRRPFAKWELAEAIVAPKAGLPGQEETVAETLTTDGSVIGRWVVTWSENGRGTCRKVGTVVRCANESSSSLPSARARTKKIFQRSRGAAQIKPSMVHVLSSCD